jgi:hypothetical protein
MKFRLVKALIDAHQSALTNSSLKSGNSKIPMQFVYLLLKIITLLYRSLFDEWQEASALILRTMAPQRPDTSQMS